MITELACAQAAYEEDLDEVFDVAAVRAALDSRLRSLESELHQVPNIMLPCPRPVVVVCSGPPPLAPPPDYISMHVGLPRLDARALRVLFMQHAGPVQ